MRGWMLRPGPRADRYHRGTLTTRPTTKAPGTNRDPRTAAISTYQDPMVRGAVPRTKRWARYTRAHLFRFLGSARRCSPLRRGRSRMPTFYARAVARPFAAVTRGYQLPVRGRCARRRLVPAHTSLLPSRTRP